MLVLGVFAYSRLTEPPPDLGPARPAPTVRLGNRWFTVVGVLAAIPLAPDVERSVLVGWTAARTWLGFDGHPTVVYVRARESQLEAVRSVLASYATARDWPPRLVDSSLT